MSSGTDGSFSFEGPVDGAERQVSALVRSRRRRNSGRQPLVRRRELKEDATLVDGGGGRLRHGEEGQPDGRRRPGLLGTLETVPWPTSRRCCRARSPTSISRCATASLTARRRVNIRGKTSIGAGGSALVLIDGVEGDPAMLNPQRHRVCLGALATPLRLPSTVQGSTLRRGAHHHQDPGKLTDKFTINYTGNRPHPAAHGHSLTSTTVTSIRASSSRRMVQLTVCNEPTGFNNSLDPFACVALHPSASANWRATTETTVDPDGKYVYGNTNYDALYKNTVIAQTHNVLGQRFERQDRPLPSGRPDHYDGLFNFTPDSLPLR